MCKSRVLSVCFCVWLYILYLKYVFVYFIFNYLWHCCHLWVLVSERDTECSLIFFQRHFRQLREELGKLKTPDGLEDLADPAFQFTSPPASTVQSSVDSNETSSVVGGSSEGFAPFGATGGVSNSQKYPVEENAHHDIDTDIEMEKMVSKVCE